jgi:hypothetical protein
MGLAFEAGERGLSGNSWSTELTSRRDKVCYQFKQQRRTG